MTESLFLKNLWYFAMHGSFLKQGKLVGKQILGEKIVFGRDENNQPFALKDNCPHRGVPLSGGWYDGKELQCAYHGWKFNHKGACTGNSLRWPMKNSIAQRSRFSSTPAVRSMVPSGFTFLKTKHSCRAQKKAFPTCWFRQTKNLCSWRK